MRLSDTFVTIGLDNTTDDVETRDNKNLTYTIVSGPAHGTLTTLPRDPPFRPTYTPAAGFTRTDRFTYHVTDRGDPDNCSGAAPGCAAPQTSNDATITIDVDP